MHTPVAEASTETVLHSFGNGTDGITPSADLINVEGTLYGTTVNGGAYNYGTVFSINPQTGAETVLYSFCSKANCPDGDGPSGALINVNGTLYGTTQSGGAYNNNAPYNSGTFFSFNPQTGVETVLHSFGSGTDGWFPLAGLIKIGGKLYGTTNGGGVISNTCGSVGCGTVFSLNLKTGAETLLHSFVGVPSDGAYPGAGLINVGGTLYGTTQNGGLVVSAGTIFSINPQTRAEMVLYSFCSQANCTDGLAPFAALINIKGKFFSTTSAGGSYNLGTVYSFDPRTGAEAALYSFGNGIDGQTPIADLTKVGGKLYGTTYGGGTYGYGAAFSLDWKTGLGEKVLHSFGNGPDGLQPAAGLINIGNMLYGTTFGGGTYGNYGTVFSIVP